VRAEARCDQVLVEPQGDPVRRSMDKPIQSEEQSASSKRILLALKEARAKLEAYERARSGPIAVVGIGCRFPGGADNPAWFWQVLRTGTDTVTEVPRDRWDADAYFDPDPEAPGKCCTRYGAFLRQPIDSFDAEFFGITPRETRSLDPQQRLVLEVGWEALEHAGIAPDTLFGTRTGVFLGLMTNDFMRLQVQQLGAAEVDMYTGTGSGMSFLAGRLSHFLGIRGPSMVVATECSSSLVAVHLACQALRGGECDTVLAGGVNTILSPDMGIMLTRMRAISPDGRCKTFDAAADGFSRGEGCGVVVLKRLEDAQRDNDTVFAVIAGSAVNHDGRSSGLTVPNSRAQQELIRQALINARLHPAQVQYIEAHGTGTSLGDPIEVGALAAVFGPDRAKDQPLLIGSVKTNMGHLEAAAGVVGLIKVVLALWHGEIPPHLHFHRPSPHIAWDELPVKVPVVCTQWPAAERRVAGVSSFGMSGINAHVVLEQPTQAQASTATVDRPLHMLTLSAKTPQALQQLVERYREALDADPARELADVCFTANTGRAHHAHRLAVLADTNETLASRLGAFSPGAGASAGLFHATAASGTLPRIAFLFTGQGSQYPGMGYQLFQTQPTFQRAMRTCDEILRPLLPVPLLSVLYPQEGQQAPLDATVYAQPALFALEYALAQLWRSWGIEPSLVMGHGVGEYAAACVAGVFNLKDGLTLVAHRARLMQALPAGGRMVAVLADERRVTEAIRPYAGDVALAAVNGPCQTVISGRAASVDAAVARLHAQSVPTRVLSVSHAFHSPLVEPMLQEFGTIAGGVSYAAPELPLVSNVSGQVAGSEIARPEYWVRHARGPVRFSQSIGTLAERGCRIFLELGPRPTLLTLARACLDSADPLWLASLRRRQPDWATLLESVSQLYTRGVRVDWRGFDRDYPRRKTILPTYPFQRKRYWMEYAPSAPPRDRVMTRQGEGRAHPLLGHRVPSAGKEVLFQQQIGTGTIAFLSDHCIQGTPIMPASAFLEMAMEAGKQLLNGRRVAVERVTIDRALAFPKSDMVTTQCVVVQDGADACSFQVFSRAEGDRVEEPTWTRHVSGVIVAAESHSEPVRRELSALQAECPDDIPVADYYQWCRDKGLEYGPSFRAIDRLQRGQDSALCRIQLPASLTHEAGNYTVHPALLDGCFQTLGGILAGTAGEMSYVPVGFERLQWFDAPGPGVWSHARIRPGQSPGQATLTADIRILDADGRQIARVDGLRAKQIRPHAMQEVSVEDWFYTVRWRPQLHPRGALPPDYLASSATLRDRLVAQVTQSHREAVEKGYPQLLAGLETLSLQYAVNALRKLGMEFRRGDRLATEEVARRLGVAPRHRRLLDRLLEMLVEEGILERDGSQFAVASLPKASEPGALLATLAERFPDAASQCTLLGRCGGQLADVLRGSCDPLELLFPDGDTTLLTELYQDSPGSREMNQLVREAVSGLLEHLPRGRGVRILEIGAGTGGTTAVVLPRLPAARTEYAFTDVSPLFTAKAQRRFADLPFVRYDVLDIERPPGEQGFEPSSYDIVIAANVLHATRDLGGTLGHVRDLLADGGLLLLVEGTARLRWVDLIFGLTEGWWRFADEDLRPDHPLLSSSRWQGLLEETGYEDIEAFSEEVVDAKAPAPQALLLARKVRKERSFADGEVHQHWLILADRGGTGQQLASLLQSADAACTLVFAGPAYERSGQDAYRVAPACAEDFRRMLSEQAAGGRGEPRGVVHLWSLDAADVESLTAAELQAASELGCQSTLHLVQALARAEASESPSLYLVTRGAQAIGADDSVSGAAQSTLWGMGKVVALEHPELHCVRLDLDPDDDADAARVVFDEIRARRMKDPEDQVVFRGGARYVARLTRGRQCADPTGIAAVEMDGDRPVRLAISRRGTLDNLQLVAAERRAPERGEVEIRVRAAGLNFIDVLDALGLLPFERSGGLGGECAGEVVATGEGVQGIAVGDAVVAIAPGGFSQYVTANAEFVIAKPDRLGFEEAATIPIAFLTAFLALHDVAKIRPGDRVLVHAAAGGTGMAAVQLAQAAGAEVFATASPTKWDVVKSLGVQHVMNSRTTDFAAQVGELTHGRGVDIVLNSLAGEFIPKSLSTLAADGRFLEIGKTGVWSAEQVRRVRPDVEYHLVDLLTLLLTKPEFVRSMMVELLRRFEQGVLRPLPRTLFDIRDAVAAFRHMQAAKHVGKIVLRLPDPASPDEPLRMAADGSYLITGGLGGLGLVVARWMVERGARHLLLLGRGGGTEETAGAIRELEEREARVVVARADVGSEDQLRRTLREASHSLPPVRGVIHSAGVLKDGVLLQQDWDRFVPVLGAKVQGAWNLHALTRDAPLDFFVLFSSAASMLGTPGQANHAAANAFLDALAFRRRAEGLPALSINWGAWSEVGAAAKRQVGQRVETKGIGTISPHEGLDALERLMRKAAPQVGVMPVDWPTLLKQFAAPPFLDEFQPRADRVGGQLTDFAKLLGEVPAADRHALVVARIQKHVAAVSGLDVTRIDARQPLVNLGLDSLIALELRNKLGADLGVEIPIAALLEGSSVEGLASLIVAQLGGTDTRSADRESAAGLDIGESGRHDDGNWEEGEI